MPGVLPSKGKLKERERGREDGVGGNEWCFRSQRTLWTTVEAFPLHEMRRERGLVSRGDVTNTNSRRQYLELGTLLREQVF